MGREDGLSRRRHRSRSHLSPLFSKRRGLRKASAGTWRGAHRGGGRVPSTPLNSSQATAAVSFPASLTAPGPGRGWSRN